MPIRVTSLDYDGCICPANVKDINNIIKENAILFDEIKRRANSSKLIIFIGSNRQSFRLDLKNSVNRGTVPYFLIAKCLSDYLGGVLDKLVLADVYNNVEPGTAYERALEDLKSLSSNDYEKKEEELQMALESNLKSPKSDAWLDSSHLECLYDVSKMSVLYAQMHKIALENPDENIDFYFYDDDVDRVCLPLTTFFSEYSRLIPKNINLRINLYSYESKTAAEEIGSIQGTGLANPHYFQWINELGLKARRAKEKDYCGRVQDGLLYMFNLADFYFRSDRKHVDDQEMRVASEAADNGQPSSTIPGSGEISESNSIINQPVASPNNAREGKALILLNSLVIISIVLMSILFPIAPVFLWGAIIIASVGIVAGVGLVCTDSQSNEKREKNPSSKSHLTDPINPPLATLLIADPNHNEKEKNVSDCSSLSSAASFRLFDKQDNNSAKSPVSQETNAMNAAGV